MFENYLQPVDFYKARSAKVKLLHRCFQKVSLVVAELLKHFWMAAFDIEMYNY